VTAAIPLPTGLLLDAASWAQTPLVVRQVVVQLLAIIRQQAARIAALEARVSQNSSNSDRPPSSDPPYQQRTACSGEHGRPGAKRGHPGHRQAPLVPTEIIEVTPETWPCGQREFHAPTPYHTHQVIELPEIYMRVMHVILHEARCPQCDRLLKAPLPEKYRYDYGPRLTALIGELSGSQRDSRSMVQEFCTSVLGVPMSRGAIQRVVERVSEAIIPHYEAIAAKARGAEVNYIDETAWYQHGVLTWLWVMVNATVALFKVQAGRSKAAFEALVEHWAGLLVSDRYGVYQHWVHGQARLIRRARGLSERKEAELAKFGHRVMVELQRLVHWATAPPTAGDVQTWYARMVHLLADHRQRRDEAGTFARTLEREMGALWTFVVEKGVEPTNNRAERALRFAVLWRRMMQGTYNEKGDRWVERILSLRETCRLRGKPTFPVLVDAVTCSFNGQQPDVSWI
jgi:transposase